MKIFHLPLLAILLAAPLLAQHDEHASAEPAPTPESTAGSQEAEAAAADPHAGHDMSAMPPIAAPAAPDPMAGHDMDAMAAGLAPEPPESPPPPQAFSGPDHAADALFDPMAMTGARAHLRDDHGDFRTYWLMADQLETRIRDGDKVYLWDAQGWYGGDINKLWVKTEGEGNTGESPDEVELQLLWSRAIAPWWDFQVGVRHDFRPAPERTHLVVGLQGLAPYQFELDAAAFLSDKGDLSGRVEAEYDLRITQRLILQPRAGIDLAAQDVPERGIGSGLSSAELGLRLRYEFARELAPYIGLEYAHSFGDTAAFQRMAGEEVGGWNFLLGMRTWF